MASVAWRSSRFHHCVNVTSCSRSQNFSACGLFRLSRLWRTCRVSHGRGGGGVGGGTTSLAALYPVFFHRGFKKLAHLGSDGGGAHILGITRRSLMKRKYVALRICGFHWGAMGGKRLRTMATLASLKGSCATMGCARWTDFGSARDRRSRIVFCLCHCFLGEW